jgi:hypothetical protein
LNYDNLVDVKLVFINSGGIEIDNAVDLNIYERNIKLNNKG